MTRRVVITGLGAITPLGPDVVQTWSALASGRSGIRAWRNVAADTLHAPTGAEVLDFDPAAHFDSRQLPALDRFSQLALVAAREARRDARLSETGALGERFAAIVGTGIGGQATQEESYRRMFAENAKRFHPLVVPRIMPSAAASHVSIELGITGPSFATVSACASSAHALVQAAALIRAGLIDMAFAGGSEACLTPGTIKSWEALRVLSRDTCRPFSKDRSGLVLGEGAAVLVLEELEHAHARGATLHAELLGVGMSSDAHDLLHPTVDGATRAMRAALTDAALDPSTIDYVNAHGTATAANDVTETRALREVFGAHAESLAVSSTKSMHGHLLGAAGALEAIVSVLAIRHHVVPPTANFTSPGEGCDLDYVPNVARAQSIRTALSSSFAFGGSNAVLVFGAL